MDLWGKNNKTMLVLLLETYLWFSRVGTFIMLLSEAIAFTVIAFFSSLLWSTGFFLLNLASAKTTCFFIAYLHFFTGC